MRPKELWKTYDYPAHFIRFPLLESYTTTWWSNQASLCWFLFQPPRCVSLCDADKYRRAVCSSFSLNQLFADCHSEYRHLVQHDRSFGRRQRDDDCAKQFHVDRRKNRPFAPARVLIRYSSFPRQQIELISNCAVMESYCRSKLSMRIFVRNIPWHSKMALLHLISSEVPFYQWIIDNQFDCIHLFW